MEMILLMVGLLNMILLLIVVLILSIKLKKSGNGNKEFEKQVENFQNIQQKNQNELKTEIKVLSAQQETQQNAQLTQWNHLSETLARQQQISAEQVAIQLAQFEKRLGTMEQTNEQKLTSLRETMERQLVQMQQTNEQKLSQMNETVNEKLQHTLDAKMKQVSDQLQEVYKGLGEMQTLANGVGDLKKVLSNVKTRGILGEIQLGAILQEILAPEQYDTNVAVVRGSRERVEFAVKFPDDHGGFVYLPIDSKFPGVVYYHLQEAYESGSAEAVSKAAKELSERLKLCAKDIHDKYIAPPDTTSFGILFLPFEGLYAEAVNRGMVEELQRLYQINLAGPSTMAALLNSLQMGFRTLAIQKRSNEVWKVLSSVRTEFNRYREALNKAQSHLRLASQDIDLLITTRTNQMERKLSAIELPDAEQQEKESLFEASENENEKIQSEN